MRLFPDFDQNLEKKTSLFTTRKGRTEGNIFYEPQEGRTPIGRNSPFSRVPVGSVVQWANTAFHSSLLEHAGTRTNVRLHLLRKKKKKRSESCVAVSDQQTTQLVGY